MSGGLAPEQQALAAELRAYRPADGEEASFRQRILQHVLETRLWWHRDTLPGHVTASAFVIDPELGSLLLHHHRRLRRWLQLGGHDDGERSPSRAVLREVREESGLADVAFLGGQPAIFDLDVHPIPAAGAMPAHEHLDVRYLLVARREQALLPGRKESTQLAWFPLAEAIARLDEPGAGRVHRKVLELRRALAGR